jgi:hypothetical protein
MGWLAGVRGLVVTVAMLLVTVAMLLVLACAAEEAPSEESTTAGTTLDPSSSVPNSSSGSSSSDSEAVTASTSEAGSSGDGSTTTGGPSCAPRQGWTCGPWDCEASGHDLCGGAAVFDELGCPRPRCAVNGQCGAGEVCFHPSDCNTDHDCDQVLPNCQECDDEPDGCCCAASGGCTMGNPDRYCIPADARPC